MFLLATRLSREVVGLFNYLLPPACALCLTPLDPPEPDQLCQTCLDQIPKLGTNCCPHCALPYPSEEGGGHLCKTCLAEKKPIFTTVTALGSYDGLLREAIHRLKYRGDINLDRPLAHLLGLKLQEDRITTPDLIVPMPLHTEKRRQRGYNQSTLLAKRIARQLDIPFAGDLLVRTRSGQPQQTLSASNRTRNVKNAFALRRELTGISVLLVDDVMTTGATSREAARTLMAGGAQAVQVAILARAGLK